MKSGKKFTERWIKVATISKERDAVSLRERPASAGEWGAGAAADGSTGSVRSTATARTTLGGETWPGAGRSEGGGAGSCLGWTSPGAVSSGCSDLAKLTLGDFIGTVRENAAALHQTDQKGDTALHHAALRGRDDIIKYILDCGGESGAQDSGGDTPLHWAVRGHSQPAVNELMRAGADPAVLNDSKMAPLHLACDLNQPDMVQTLCSYSEVDVNIPGEYGQTPLHYCAIKNSIEAAKKLMRYKPLLCKRDDNGVFVIHCAATHASREVLSILLEKAEESGYTREYILRQADKEKNTALHSAVNSGSEEAVRVCLEFGSSLDVLQEDKSTPLHLAASQGSLPIVKLLLGPPESNQTLGMCDVEDMTPLHRAAMFDHVDVVEYLVSQGADMDALEKGGLSPLLLAVSRGSYRSAMLLNKHGADCSLRDHRSRNILHLAVLSGKTLTAYGLDALKSNVSVLLNDVDYKGCTPIHYATRDGNLKSVQNLIELGATVNLKNLEKQSPLHFAAKYGRFNSCKRLLDSSIGPNIINDIDGEGMTALHIAASNGHGKVIQLLLLRGALLHRDYKGRSPLHLAAMGGFSDCMKLLMTTHGYLLDQADDHGNTALLLAAAADMPKSVDFLLSANAALTLNDDKRGLMATAVAANNVDVAQTIVAHQRWQEVIHIYLMEQPNSLKNLITRVPQVYKNILDRSVTRSVEHPNSADFWVKYDFRFLQPPFEERLRMEKEGLPYVPLPSMNLMLDNKEIDLLAHPVCVEYLNMKWKSYGAYIHMLGMALHVCFLGSLMAFIIGNGDYYKHTGNRIHALNDTAGDTVENGQDDLNGWIVVMAWVMSIYSGLNILKEINQIMNQRCKYFADFINYMEWGLYGCTLVFTVPFLLKNSCADDPDLCAVQWQCGAVASFLAWFLVLLYQQRIDVIGIYVVMFEVIVKTLVRVLAVFSVLILAFTFPLFMLMKDEENKAFSTPLYATFRVFTMMMAEIDFINSFVGPAADDDPSTMPFVHLTFVVLALLVIALPIVLMNLLIGLAVGDIAKVQQDAKLKRLAMQVELYTEMEQKIPTKVMGWLDVDHIHICPNRKMCAQHKYKVNKFIEKFKKKMTGIKDDSEKKDTVLKSIAHFRVTEDAEQSNTELGSLKRKFKKLSTQMDKQYDLLRLIVQKMDISSEADDQDEGMAPPRDNCCQGRIRVDLPQVVKAAAMLQKGAKERLKLYQPTDKNRGNKPPEPSV